MTKSERLQSHRHSNDHSMKGKNISYLICTTHRSGSFLLCDTLTATDLAGRPSEYFLPQNEKEWSEKRGASTYDEYLSKVVAETSSPNGVFGSKMMFEYFGDSLAKLRALPRFADEEIDDASLLCRVFPNLKYIWLTRTNKLRQAVSYLRAWQSQSWATNQEPLRSPEYSFELLDMVLSKIVLQEVGWQEFFAANSIVPFVVTYEDFVPHQELTIGRILDFLEIPYPETLVSRAQTARRQADEITEEWVHRFITDKTLKWGRSAPWPKSKPNTEL